MYGIFTYIWVILKVNVNTYSIHGAYGYLFGCFLMPFLLVLIRAMALRNGTDVFSDCFWMRMSMLMLPMPTYYNHAKSAVSCYAMLCLRAINIVNQVWETAWKYGVAKDNYTFQGRLTDSGEWGGWGSCRNGMNCLWLGWKDCTDDK
jgi:hypothetical protein